jgi:hypothetical protein
MRKVPYLLAAASIIGLVSVATTSSASPLASGLATGSTAMSVLNGDPVEKVQAWSCQEKLRDMTLEQRRFCRGDYDDYYDDGYGYYGPGYVSPGYGYGYPTYGLGIPFLGFEFGDGHHHHHHWGKWH